MIALRSLKDKRSFKYATFDVESTMDQATDGYTNLAMVGFYDGKDYFCFQTMEELVRHIFSTKKYQQWRIFAHNGGRFDFNFLMIAIEESFPDIDCRILSSGGISMIVATKPSSHCCWYFCDSMKLFPMSLKKVTYTFNVPHKKLDMPLNEIGWNDKTKEYNMYDCMGLYESLGEFYKWQNEHDIGLKPTLASQSMSYFRSTMNIIIPNLTPMQEIFIRQGYYGGRTEIYKMLCEKKLYCYDVNSMYPYVMKKYAMPCGVPREVNTFMDDAIGFYAATIIVPDDVYLPLLPVRRNGKMIFPVGIINGVYSSIELLRAEKMGCDITIHGGYIFGSEFLFDEFVDNLYQIKLSGNDGEKMIAKLMLNSCYGKFGQNREKKALIRLSDLNKAVGLTPWSMDHGIFETTSVSKATFIIPSIASWITSCARVELFDFLDKAGEKNIYYCDTDSVMATKSMPSGNLLGQLKMEREVNRALFLQPKNYVLETTDGTIVKAKGYEREFISGLCFDDYYKGLSGDYSSFNQTVKRFAGFKESVKRNNNFVSMIDRKKSIQSPYDKRKVVENYDTIPLVFQ